MLKLVGSVYQGRECGLSTVVDAHIWGCFPYSKQARELKFGDASILKHSTDIGSDLQLSVAARVLRLGFYLSSRS